MANDFTYVGDHRYVRERTSLEPCIDWSVWRLGYGRFACSRTSSQSR